MRSVNSVENAIIEIVNNLEIGVSHITETDISKSLYDISFQIKSYEIAYLLSEIQCVFKIDFKSELLLDIKNFTVERLAHAIMMEGGDAIDIVKTNTSN
jgi:hypothetical protein